MAKKTIARNNQRGCLWLCCILFLCCLAIAALTYIACAAAGVGLWFLARYCWRKLVVQAPDSKFVKKMIALPPIARQVGAGIACAIFSLTLMSGLASPARTINSETPSQVAKTQKEKASDTDKEKGEKPTKPKSTGIARNPKDLSTSDLVVKFIDVGQGDASIVEFPDGKTMLIDTPDGEANTVISALKADNRSTVNWLVATHPDADHIGGLDTVISSMPIGSVWAPETNSPTQTYTHFLTAISNKGMDIEPAYAGRQIATSESYAIDILWPQQSASYSEDNAYSVVIKITYGENTFLFTGDAPVEAQNNCVDGHIDVLKVSHHGSASGLNNALATKMTPKIAVLSYGKNSYGHPTQVVLDALSAVGSQVFGTHANGTITVISNGREVTASASREGAIEAASQDSGTSSQGIGTSGGSSDSSVQEPASPQTAPTETAPRVDANTDETVVITPTGKKYHRPGCRTTKRSNSLTEMTKSQAEAQGYAPCGVCNP